MDKVNYDIAEGKIELLKQYWDKVFKKKNLIILGLLLVISTLGFMLLVLSGFNKTLLAENKEYREDLEFAGYNEIYLNNELNHLTQFHTFRNALDDVNIADYDRQHNNCWDQSQGLQQTLRDMGIESTIGIVEDRGHAFLMVWIEATTGDFISPEAGYNLIEFRESKYNVICNNE